MSRTRLSTEQRIQLDWGAEARACQNPGFYFDLMVPPGIRGEEWSTKSRTKALRGFNEALPVPDAYREYRDELKPILEQCQVHVEAVTAGPYAVGLGGPGTLEQGCRFDRVFGVVAPTGSGIKGAMRRTLLRALGLDQAARPGRWGDYKPDLTLDKATELLGVDEANAEKLAQWLELFGTTESAGALTVHDALLLEGAPNSGGKFLMRDVVTVHHAEYYQGKQHLPKETDEPVPNPFVAVRPGVKYLFAVDFDADDATAEALRPQIRRLLKLTLEETGLGAKTNAGYGRFRVA